MSLADRPDEAEGTFVITKAEATRLLLEETARLPPEAGGCALCGLVLPGQAERLRVAEDDEAVVVVDQFARRRGHLMVVLRGHVEDLTALAWPRYAALQHLAWEAATAMTRVLSPRRVYVAALGAPSALPTSFPHIHLHIVPLHHGDERDRPANVFTFTGGVLRYQAGAAEALADELREAWPRRER